MRPSRRLFVAAATLLSACAFGTTAPDGGRREAFLPGLDVSAAATPSFLQADATAPAIANPIVTFWARKGVDQTVFMYYASRPGQADSTVFMRFRVRRRSLSLYPNGQPIADGDSVLITATLVDPVQLIVDFQPSGLVFDAGDPAELKLSYLETDPDWNQDGVVDKADDKLQRKFSVWELHGALPWAPLLSKVAVGQHEVEASVGGFTRYAVAY